MRTSVSHPLQIATVVSGVSGLGRVGVTLCPGKYDPRGGRYQPRAIRWNRDLARDLDAIRDWGATAVVTLLEPEEPLHRAVRRSGVIVAIPILAGLLNQYVRI
jgi:ADP-ribosyl-[dinitrogen reductase] hydrolase